MKILLIYIPLYYCCDWSDIASETIQNFRIFQTLFLRTAVIHLNATKCFLVIQLWYAPLKEEFILVKCILHGMQLRWYERAKVSLWTTK